MADSTPRSPSLRRPLILSLLSWAMALVVGCAEEPPVCYDGEYEACTCSEEEGGEGQGYARCDAGSYGPCDCASGTPGLGGAAAVGAGGSGGADGGGGGMDDLLGFLEPCDEDAQCETGLCQHFNAKGPHCSQPCSDPSDCPAPSPGCNMMGICKAP